MIPARACGMIRMVRAATNSTNTATTMSAIKPAMAYKLLTR